MRLSGSEGILKYLESLSLDKESCGQDEALHILNIAGSNPAWVLIMTTIKPNKPLLSSRVYDPEQWFEIVCIDYSKEASHPSIEELILNAKKEEREACAKIAEKYQAYSSDSPFASPGKIAKEILERK